MPSTSTSTDYALIRLAARLPRRDYPTGASVARALAQMGEPATRAAVARVRPVLEQLAAARAARRPLGIPGMLRGVDRPMFPRGPARLSTLSLAERLERYRRSLVRRAFAMAGIRMARRDELHVVFSPSASPDAAAVDHLVSTTYPYRGRFRGRPARAAHLTLTLPRDWATTVHGRGLAVVDGILTLSVRPLPSGAGGGADIPGLELFAAVVLRQRHYACERHGLIIARAGSYTAHAQSTVDAVGTLRKKLRHRAGRDRHTDVLSRLIRGLETVDATLADADAVGACRFGCAQWAAAVGLNPEAGAITLAELAAGYRLRPMPEARAIALHVVRRARAERRAARAQRSAA